MQTVSEGSASTILSAVALRKKLKIKLQYTDTRPNSPNTDPKNGRHLAAKQQEYQCSLSMVLLD